MSSYRHSSGIAALLMFGILLLGGFFLSDWSGKRTAPAQDQPPAKGKKEVEATAEVEQAEKEQEATAKEVAKALEHKADVTKEREKAEKRPLEDPPKTTEQRQQYEDDIKHWRTAEQAAIRDLTVKTLADTAAKKQVTRLKIQRDAIRDEEAGAPADSVAPPNPIGYIAPRLGPTFARAQEIGQALQPFVGVPQFWNPPDADDPLAGEPFKYQDPRIIPPSIEEQIARVQDKWESPQTTQTPTGGNVPDVGPAGPVVEGTTWSGGGGTFRFDRGGSFIYTAGSEQQSGSWRQNGNVVEAWYQKRYPRATMTVEFRITINNGTATCFAKISGVDVFEETYTLRRVK